MKIVLTILGIVVAAIGGVNAYRAFFLDPSSAVVITNTEIQELPNYTKVFLGMALFVAGAAVAFLSARRIGR
jgi:hypothetical protein